jgi:hypothetical protein
VNNHPFKSLVFNGNNLFAIGIYGIYLSSDNGTNWDTLNNGLTYPTINSIAFNGDNIYAGGDGGVYLSTNIGINWQKLTPDYLSSASVNTLVVFETNIVAGTAGDGVYYSTDNGINWTYGGLNNTDVISSTISGNNIYVGTYGAGVWKRPLSELTAVTKEINDLPKDFSLSQNYPNPFNPGTVISYSLPSSSNIKLIVYNTLGQTIKTLESGYKTAGNYSFNFNASDLPSGIYFYKLEAGSFSQIKKMILIK